MMDKFTDQIKDLIDQSSQFNQSEYEIYQVRVKWETLFQQIQEDQNSPYYQAVIESKDGYSTFKQIIKFISHFIQMHPEWKLEDPALTLNQKQALFNIINGYFITVSLGRRVETIFNTLFLWRCCNSDQLIYQKIEPILIEYITERFPSDNKYDLSEAFGILNYHMNYSNDTSNYQHEIFNTLPQNDLELWMHHLTFPYPGPRHKRLILLLEKYENQGYMPHLETWEFIGRFFNGLKEPDDGTNKKRDVFLAGYKEAVVNKTVKQIDDIVESFCQFNITEKQWNQCSSQIQTIIDLIENCENDKLKEKLSKLQYDHVHHRFIIQLIKIYLPYSRLHEKQHIQLTREQIRVLVSIVNKQYVTGYSENNRWAAVINTLFIWKCHGYDKKLFQQLSDLFDNFFDLVSDPNKPTSLSDIFGDYQAEGYNQFFKNCKEYKNDHESRLVSCLSEDSYESSFYQINRRYFERYQGQYISAYLSAWQNVGEELDKWFIPSNRSIKLIQSRTIIDQIDDRIEDLCEFNPYDSNGKKLISKIETLLNFINEITSEKNRFKIEPVKEEEDDRFHRKQLFDFIEQYLPCSQLASRKYPTLTREQKIGYLGTLYPVFRYRDDCDVPYQTILSNLFFIWKHCGYRLDQFKRIKKIMLPKPSKYFKPLLVTKSINQFDVMKVFNYKLLGYPWEDGQFKVEDFSGLGWIEKGILNGVKSFRGESPKMIGDYFRETSGQPYTDHLELWRTIGEKLIQIGVEDMDKPPAYMDTTHDYFCW